MAPHSSSVVLPASSPVTTTTARSTTCEGASEHRGIPTRRAVRRAANKVDDPSLSAALAVDVGGTTIKAGLVGADGNIQHLVRAPTPSGRVKAADVIDRIVEAAREACSALPRGSQPVGAGISTPAFAVGPDWCQLLCSNIPCLEGVPLRGPMVAAFGPNTFWEYDTHAACLAEMRYGRAAGCERVLYVGIGTGTSCAVSIDGQFVRHTFGTCGNTGHIIVSSGSNRKCTCGGTGCLEAVLSGWALKRAALSAADAGGSPYLRHLLRDSGSLEAIDVWRAADQGDPAALTILEEAGKALGQALATLMHIYSPDVIVVGGGVSAAGELLLQPARDEVNALASPTLLQRLRAIEAGVMGSDAGVIGLGSLVFDEIANPGSRGPRGS